MGQPVSEPRTRMPFMSQDPRGASNATLAMCLLVGVSFLSCPELLSGQHLLWQLNSGGDDISIIDYSEGTIVRVLEVGPEPHGIAAPTDFRVVYVSLEANSRENGEILWIDPATYEIKARLEVGLEPHEIASTPDGRWIYVPCRDGHYWIVDGHERRVVKRIYTGGRPHNTTATPDGRYMFLSPMGDPHRMTVVDVEAGHEVVGQIDFGESLRPPALSYSHQLIFQHIDGLHGFQVADLRDRSVVATVEHAGSLGWFLLPMKKLGWISFDGLKRCHGLEVRPDEMEVWSTCGDRVNVHSIGDPDFTQVAAVELQSDGYWLTFSPDAQHAFVALSDEDRVVMIDTGSKEPLRHFQTGRSPKRNLVVPAPPSSRH